MVETIYMGINAFYTCEDNSRSAVRNLTAACSDEDIWTIAQALNSLQVSPMTTVNRTDLYRILQID